MNHEEAGRFWNDNAEAWTKLVRAGYDLYRNYFNTPAFFAMLPDINGLTGLDIGCGEGYNTRLLAQQGAKITAVDISGLFIDYAQQAEAESPLGITYLVGSAVELPFADQSFDFAAGFMSLMDVPELEKALSEAYRILKPGGFLQFSISHPCFSTAHRRNLRGADGLTYAIEVGKYFHNLDGEIEEWIFGAAPPAMKEGLSRFKVPRFTYTLAQWINALIATGFVIERLEEPCPDDETIRAYPYLQDAQVVAYFLHVRVRKPVVP